MVRVGICKSVLFDKTAFHSTICAGPVDGDGKGAPISDSLKKEAAAWKGSDALCDGYKHRVSDVLKFGLLYYNHAAASTTCTHRFPTLPRKEAVVSARQGVLFHG
jgi:hypothetical protein